MGPKISVNNSRRSGIPTQAFSNGNTYNTLYAPVTTDSSISHFSRHGQITAQATEPYGSKRDSTQYTLPHQGVHHQPRYSKEATSQLKNCVVEEEDELLDVLHQGHRTQLKRQMRRSIERKEPADDTNTTCSYSKTEQIGGKFASNCPSQSGPLYKGLCGFNLDHSPPTSPSTFRRQLPPLEPEEPPRYSRPNSVVRESNRSHRFSSGNPEPPSTSRFECDPRETRHRTSEFAPPIERDTLLGPHAEHYYPPYHPMRKKEQPVKRKRTPKPYTTPFAKADWVDVPLEERSGDVVDDSLADFSDTLKKYGLDPNEYGCLP